MTLDEAIKSLMALQAKLAAYGHAMGLLFYDGATTAPKGTAANRGQTMSILSEEHYKLTTYGTGRRRRATLLSSSPCLRKFSRPTSASHTTAHRKRTPMTTGSASMRTG